MAASPKHVLDVTAIGGDWHRYMIDMTRVHLWSLLELKFLDLSDLDDKAFRRKFEEEWEILSGFRGWNFDFRVIPKLSWDDFVRYQRLPYGKAIIRSTLSCYMAHQAFVYPHLLKWVFIFGEIHTKLSKCPVIYSIMRRCTPNLSAS
jgi:hypothetical protein